MIRCYLSKNIAWQDRETNWIYRLSYQLSVHPCHGASRAPRLDGRKNTASRRLVGGSGALTGRRYRYFGGVTLGADEAMRRPSQSDHANVAKAPAQWMAQAGDIHVGKLILPFDRGITQYVSLAHVGALRRFASTDCMSLE